MSWKILGATSNTSSQDGTGKPPGVVESTNDATISWVGNLYNVHGSCSSSDSHAVSDEKTPGFELTDTRVIDGGAHDNCTNNYSQGSDEHSSSPSPRIDSRANKW